MQSINYTFLFAVANIGVAYGQNQAGLRHVYHLERPDGSVCIVAENHGSMPYTTTIRANLVNMRSSVPLPLRAVIAPGEKPYLLAVFAPETANNHNFSYTFNNLDGVYTGHLPDTSYVYRLPYHPVADTVLPRRAIAAGEPAQANTRYLYRFKLPVNTPICAARAGTIVAVKQQARNSKHMNANLIFVMHPDGSYGSYENIRKNSLVGQVGRAVLPGDTIGYFGGNKLNANFWFAVQYPADSLTTTVPVIFSVGKRQLRPLN